MRKNLIVLPNGTEIQSGVGRVPAIKSVSCTKQVNAETDLLYGAACATILEITLLDSSGVFSAAAGDELAYYKVEEDSTRTLIGLFRMEQPMKSTANTYKITAYDRMTLLDKDLSLWLTELEEWPYTMQALLEMVCSQCGVELATGISLVNGSFPVQRFIQNATGRQLVQWIAGANAVFAQITPEGKLSFGSFTEGGTLDLPIRSLSLTDYETAPIERVAVKQDVDDIGVAWPENSTGETYTVMANPLFTALNSLDLIPYVKNIYNRVVGITYVPADIQVYDPDGKCHPGVFLTVKNRYGKQYKTVVFSVTVRGAISTMQGTGNATRTSPTAIAGQDSVKIVQRRVARLKESVEEVSSELERTSISLDEVKKEQSTIKQQVDEVTIKVSEAVEKTIYKAEIIDNSSQVVKVENALESSISGLTVYGKTMQDTVPTPDAPAPLRSVGDTGSVAVVTARKNLWDNANTVMFYGAANTIRTETGFDFVRGDYVGAVRVYYKIPIVKGQTVTFSCSYKGSGAYCYIYQDQSMAKYLSAKIEKVKYTALADYPDATFAVVLNSNAVDTSVTNIQVELGDSATDHEPYNGSVINTVTSKGLLGIPMQTACKKHNHTDKGGQKWFTDEIDLAKGVHIRRCFTVAFDGTEDWVVNSAGNFIIGTNELPALGNFDAGNKAPDNGNCVYVCCSHFKPVTYSKVYGDQLHTGECTSYGSTRGNTLAFRYELYSHDLEGWKAYLAAQAAAGTPMTVILGKNAPEEIELDPETLAAFRQLYNPPGNFFIYSTGDIMLTLADIASGKEVNNAAGAAANAQASADDAKEAAAAAKIAAATAQDTADGADQKAEATKHELTKQAAALQMFADSVNISVSEMWKEVGEKADQGQVVEIVERFRFASDGMTISNSATGMGIVVSEECVDFTGGEDPTTEITPNEMATTNLRVGRRFDLGDFALIPRTNGNLSLRYMGGV